jgi:hypothetical protein
MPSLQITQLEKEHEYENHRGPNRLGFAVQLCAARYVGAFPEDLTETPAVVVSILGRQLSIEHPSCFAKVSNETRFLQNRWL